MTIEQAMKVIEQNLDFYLDPVPPFLLKRIKEVILRCKTITEKQYVLATQRSDPPDLKNEWLQLCEKYKVNPDVALRRCRMHKYISIRVHFVRYILSEFNNSIVSVSDLARFMDRDHSMIIHYRDYSKVDCALPPLGISTWSKNSRKVRLKQLQK